MELFYKQEEKCSGKIEDRLAKIVNDSMRTRIGETKKKDLLAKHMKPQNCEKITVPRINKGIWSSLPRKARDQDLKLQHIQSTMCKTFYPLIHLMDKLLKAQTAKQGLAQTDVTDCFALCNDTFKLLQLGFSEMSQRRRLSLRPELSNEYKALCAAEIPVTDHLFGDELEKQIKEITDAKKVSRKITDKHNQSQRYSPIYSNFKNRYTQNRQNSFKSPSYGRHTMNRNNTTKSSFLEKRQFQKFQRNKKE
ncbi:uncharacterized protein LOC134275041 [Saccostrea cucullata]|uniref:uncharacterized protein LOC134275041 n=1 Tax=Saccostrea cuccullata TaxID=36930 RepID=UPI002ED12FE8